MSIQIGPRDRKRAVLLAVATVNAVGFLISDHWGFAVGFFFGVLGFFARVADQRAERATIEHNARMHRYPIAATGTCVQCARQRRVKRHGARS